MNEPNVIEVYHEDFDSWESVKKEFELQDKECDGVIPIYAIYDIDGYEGSAWVVYYSMLDGKLYEVHASHCSCYGLEGQWAPEETSLDSIKIRRDTWGYPGIEKAVRNIEKFFGSKVNENEAN